MRDHEPLKVSGLVANSTGFINETALVLYVYLPGSWNGEESCLTVSSFVSAFCNPQGTN
jgi:hypothetical protein